MSLLCDYPSCLVPTIQDIPIIMPKPCQTFCKPGNKIKKIVMALCFGNDCTLEECQI